ncbi:aldo/keto reductase [Propioniciclava coleopterorum]|uniref:aldo/keto reductase n=1 Tax=Propioniciclava coleopterorum TaxID=2714937 RepID=UPI00202B8D48|nr:aldo/keto reductase [Propioniciclava coleopterorum]
MCRHEYERDDAPVVAETGLASFPYSTLGSGFLSGKYRGEADLVGERAGAAKRYLDAGGLPVVDALAGIAEARGVASTTVALAWLLARGVTAPIASASRASQVPALLAATTLRLTDDEVAALDAASAPFVDLPFAA